MKKKALFLAAGLAAFTAGIVSNGSTFAAQATYPFENENDTKLATALAEHSNITILSITEHAPAPNQDKRAIVVGDGDLPTSLIFDCTSGDPTEGVTDFSLLGKMGNFFSNLTTVKLCGESANAPIDYGTLPTTITSLTVGDANGSYNVTPTNDSTRPKNISTLTNLESVRLSGVPVGSLDGFKNMANLRELTVNYGGLKNINSLTSFDSVPSGIYLKGNYIENIGVLMTVCMNKGDCSTSNWDAAYENQRYLNAISENVTHISMVGDTASIPEYFTALYSKFYGYGEDSYKNYVTAEGLELNDDYDTITLTGGNEGTLTIKDPGVTTRNKYTLVFEKKMDDDDDNKDSGATDGKDNPDTGDSFSLSWMMGIAAAILATTSFVIRSRR